MVRKEKVLLKRAQFSRMISGFLPALAILVLLQGCKNDEARLRSYSTPRTTALMSAKDIDVIYSESGHIQARVTGPVVNRFSGDYPFLEFPKGFMIYIYDSTGGIETTITGDYGKRNETSRIMEAKGNVVVRNEIRHQQLNTEFLTWDERKHLISSQVPVKITTPDKILFGDGLVSNETFTDYTITRPRGQMSVKRDTL
jgi:LPS export ABC transporter protein LptC